MRPFEPSEDQSWTQDNRAMIISRLTGGLGNQMFQYAAGLALAEKHRTALKLDLSWFDASRAAHERYSLHCLNVIEQFATQAEVDALVGSREGPCERVAHKAAAVLRMHRLAQLLQPLVGRQHPQKTLKFYPEFFDQPDNTCLSGVFQSIRFFAPVAEELKLQFTFRYPAPPEVDEIADQIRESESVAVHFRRGDYVTKYSSTIGWLQIKYYEEALALLRARVGLLRLFVFSDDIEAVEKEFALDLPRTYVKCIRPINAHDKIRLMSLCKHNVISNSTFAWWGAWLNANPSKIVIAPDPFFRGVGSEGPDIVPESWIKMPITEEGTSGTSKGAA
jgi:hypothetical protein